MSSAGEQRGLGVEIIFHRLFQLRGGHAVRFLNRVFDRDVLVQDEVEVGSGFRQLLLVEQVVHHDPRFGVIDRVARAFVAVEVSCFMANKSGRGIQTCAPSNSVSDLARACRMLVPRRSA